MILASINQLPKIKTSVLQLLILSAILFSCKKESTNTEIINTQPNSNLGKINSIQKAPIPETVSLQLLLKYINYQSDLEKPDLLKKSGSKFEFIGQKMNIIEFDEMITNFLINEGNQMRQDYFIKKSTGIASNNVAPLPPVDTTGVALLPVVVVCTGTFLPQIPVIQFYSNIECYLQTR